MSGLPFHHGAQLHFVDTLAATRAREAPPIRGALRIWLGFADGPAWWPCLAADPSPTPWCHPAVDLQGTDGRCRTCGLVPRTVLRIEVEARPGGFGLLTWWMFWSCAIVSSAVVSVKKKKISTRWLVLTWVNFPHCGWFALLVC